MTDFTAIGEIVSTHGLDGGLKVYPHTDDLERFKKLGRCFIGEDKKEFLAIRAFIKKNMAVVFFEEICSIEEAQKYLKKTLYVADCDRIILEEDRYFIYDLIGCEVYSSGEKIGIIKDVYQGYANDCYEVDEGGKSFLIPAVKEFILNVDIENKKIDVKLIEGMRE